MHWLGLPGTNATVRVLRKIRPESITTLSAEDTRRMLEDTHVTQILAHMARINTGVLALVGSHRLRRAITPTLLEEVSAGQRQKYTAHTARLLDRALDIPANLYHHDADLRFRSLASLQTKHDTLSQEYILQAPERLKGVRFPRAPVRGTADIVPITNPEDLIHEGLTQANCVASYADRIASGRTYIYRVLRPERATPSINRTSRGRWMLDQLLLARNRPVSNRTREIAGDWLMTQ